MDRNIERIAAMITDDPNFITECKPNSIVWLEDDKPVNGIEFRDEPWEEVRPQIIEAFNAGYDAILIDDSVFMFSSAQLPSEMQNPKNFHVDDQFDRRSDNIYVAGSAEEALEIAYMWWSV